MGAAFERFKQGLMEAIEFVRVRREQAFAFSNYPPNTNPEARIVAKADYAVSTELHEIVPAISEEVRKLSNR